MSKNYKTTLLLLGGAFSMFVGCSTPKVPQSEGGFTYSGIYFGKNFTPIYQQGIVDGCTTAKGNYTKSHKLFNTDNAYEKGWFLGRNRCKNLLKLDKNGDLIL